MRCAGPGLDPPRVDVTHETMERQPARPIGHVVHTPWRTLARLVFATLVVFPAACKTPPASASSDPPTAHVTASAVSIASLEALPIESGSTSLHAPGGASLAEIKLLDPGGEPRSALRFQFDVHRRETVALALVVGLTLSMEPNKSAQAESSTVRMNVAIVPKDLTPQGDLRFELRIDSAEALADDPNARPEALTALNEQLALLVGLTGQALVTPRGVTRQVALQVPGNVPPTTRQVIQTLYGSLGMLASPLPEEAVGVGARWEVRIPLDTPGVGLVQTSTHVLKTFGESRGEMNVAIRQEVLPAASSRPGAQPTPGAELMSLDSHGEGTVAFDLARLVPTSHVTLESHAVYQVRGGDQVQRVAMTMRTKTLAHPANEILPH